MKLEYGPVALLLLFTSGALAVELDPTNCVHIVNADQRLACFDAVFANKSQMPDKKKGIAFSDPNGTVTVEILEILNGKEAVAKQKIYQHNIIEAQARGRRIIYFGLRITNNKFKGELAVHHFNAKLESRSGDTFSSIQTRDHLTGDVHHGKSIPGGVAFEVYPETVPELIRYKTNLESLYGKEIIAVSPALSSML